MVTIQPLSRRSVIRTSVAALAGWVAFPAVSQAKQTAIAQRDPMVVGMAPSTVAASDSFKAARGFEVMLNTQVQSESEVQNRFDLAVLEMFNVMKTNEYRLANGEMKGYITAGNVPVGTDTAAFSTELTNTPGEYLITAMYYLPTALGRADGVWGVFDAKKGLRVQFVEEPGLFEISLGMVDQIYGLTPRLAEDGALQLDIYMVNATPPPDYPNIENVPDIVHTWIMSSMIQIMMISYGSIQVYDPVRDYANVAPLYDPLFDLPYTISDTIASLLSDQPTGSTNYFDYRMTSKTCLLDYRPL